MNKSILSAGLHIVIITSLQVFLLRNAGFIFLDKYSFIVFLYPIVIFTLPLKTPKVLLLFLAFFLGIFIDLFYDSPGVHTASFVLTAYIRSGVLRLLEPRGGYRIETAPTIGHYGLSWFCTYSAILLFTHILTYFVIDTFTFVFVDKILINAISSFAISYLLILLYQIILR